MSTLDGEGTIPDIQTDEDYDRYVSDIPEHSLLDADSTKQVYAGLPGIRTAVLVQPGEDEAPIVDHSTAPSQDVVDTLTSALGGKLYPEFGQFATEIEPLSPSFDNTNEKPDESLNPSSFPKPGDFT